MAKRKKIILPVTATTWQPVMTACHDDTAFRRSQVIEQINTKKRAMLNQIQS